MSELRTNSGLASALRPVILRLARRVRQVRDEKLDLSSTQLSAMGALFRHGQLPIGELATYERVQPPSMTRTVNGLVEAGMISRTVSETDRRQCKVALTEEGRQVLAADRRRRDAWLAQRIAALSVEEREVLRKAVPVLEKVNG